MTQVLVPHAVVIGSVTSAEASALPVGSELRVGIGANPKTCKGFVSASEGRPHILCNVDRFANTNPAEQYRLIHHEYAGLARVELNVGASSDYEVSQQLTEFLVPETVLRLAVRRPIVSDQLIDSIFGDYELVSQVMDHGGHGCSSTLRLREVVVEAPQASHIRLDLDYWNHPIYTEVGRTIWEAQGYLADEDGDLHHEISQGRVTRRYEMTRLQNTLTLNIAEEFIENSGRRGFSRAFRRTRSNGGYVFGFILDRRTGLLNFNKHQYGSEDSRDSAQVCIMRRVGH